MNKKCVVRLTSEERSDLERLVSVGKAAARKLLRARVLLQADVGPQGPGRSDQRIGEALPIHPNTVAEDGHRQNLRPPRGLGRGGRRGPEDGSRVSIAGNLFGHAWVVGGERAACGNQRPGLQFCLAGRFDAPPVAAVVEEDTAWNAVPTSH
jgi:hypothetical protein